MAASPTACAMGGCRYRFGFTRVSLIHRSGHWLRLQNRIRDDRSWSTAESLLLCGFLMLMKERQNARPLASTCDQNMVLRYRDPIAAIPVQRFGNDHNVLLRFAVIEGVGFVGSGGMRKMSFSIWPRVQITARSSRGMLMRSAETLR